MTVIFRTAGAWGSGKGVNLTPAEVDGNFHDHEQRIADLETSPPEAISIEGIEATGNLLTITLTNGATHGPFVLPSASWHWTGEYQAGAHYLVNDVFAHAGAIWLVLVEHTAPSVFNPVLFSGSGHVYNELLAPAEQPYDLALFFPGRVPADGSVLLQHVAARAFALPKDLADSIALLRVAATANFVLPIEVNGTAVGQIVFSGPAESDGTQRATFEFSAAVALARGDRLAVLAPEGPDALDDTAADLSVTFAARLI